MKTNKKTNFLKAIAFIVTLFFLACEPTVIPGDPDDPNDPNDPTPMESVSPEIIYNNAESVTENQAIFFAWVKPNENNTKLYLEHRKVGETNYQKKAISGSYTGTDSIKITADLSDLAIKTEYQVRFIAINAAGADTSTVLKISTYIVKDKDGNPYHVIKIGNQYWLQENLKATHYSDGTEIPNVIDKTNWLDTSLPAFCWYDNDASNKEKNGALYNGHAAASEKVFITGFHVPTDVDWQILYEQIGGKEKGYKLADNNYHDCVPIDWIKNSNPEQNSTGFTAFPVGEKIGRDSPNNFIKEPGMVLWGKNLDQGNQYMLKIYQDQIFNDGYTQYRNWGCAIRLVKD